MKVCWSLISSGSSLSARVGVRMPAPDLSNSDSFYQLACHTTDTFASCIMIYEALLPYLKAETSDGNVKRRLFDIGGMLTALYNELTTLRNEISTAIVVVHDDDRKISKPSVESKDLTKVVNEHNQQKNIYETSTVEKKESHSEKVLNELPKRNWESVGQVLDEEQQREKVSHEDKKIEEIMKVHHELKKMEETISRVEKGLVKPTDSIKKQTSDFEYLCESCNETVTVYNQDIDLSIALHNQGGCCRRNPSKLFPVQKERQEKNVYMESAQEQVQNLNKYQEATNRLNLTSAELDTVYEVGGTDFSCIQSAGNGFICTVCNKHLTGPKNFSEHVKGSYHQNFLKESGKEIHKNADYWYGTDVTCAQPIKSCENNSPASGVQEKLTLSEKIQFLDLVKYLSGSLYHQRQYFSLEKGVLMCNLCSREIPPTSTNVRGHVAGKRHLQKFNALFSPTERQEVK